MNVSDYLKLLDIINQQADLIESLVMKNLEQENLIKELMK